MESQQLAKAVAKRLQHYLAIERREEAFDPSGSYVPERETHRLRSLSTGSYEDSPHSHVSDLETVGKKRASKMRGRDGLSERERMIRKQIERSMMNQGLKKRKSPYSVSLAKPRSGYVSADDYARPRRKRRKSANLSVGRPPSAGRRPTSQLVSKEERDRILTIATKLIVATETVALPQNRRVAKGNQTDSEQAFPHLEDGISRRQSSASDPGPRHMPHPPALTSRSSSGRGYSARSSPWGKPAWTDNRSGSGNESHDEVQTQMQRLKIHDKDNIIVSPKSSHRPGSAVRPRHHRPRNAGHSLKSEVEIQTDEIKQTNNNDDDEHDYEDDFYDHSSTEVSPMSTPRNTWSPAASVQTHDISTQTVVHTGTQTSLENGASIDFQERIVYVAPSSSLRKRDDVSKENDRPTASVGTTTQNVTTSTEQQQQHTYRDHSETTVPMETQTRRRDLEPSVITYEIYVVTGDKLGASTTAEVKITIFGEYGNSGERSLLRSKTNKTPFQRKQIDTFVVDSVYTGKLLSVRIGHNGTALGTGWYLDSVFVKEGPEATRAFEFSCGRWLSARDDDGQIIRDLPLTRVIPAIDVPSSLGNQKDKTYFNYRRLSLESNSNKRPSSVPLRGQRAVEAKTSDEQKSYTRPGTATIQRPLPGSNTYTNHETQNSGAPDIRRLPSLGKSGQRRISKESKPMLNSSGSDKSTNDEAVVNGHLSPIDDEGRESPAKQASAMDDAEQHTDKEEGKDSDHSNDEGEDPHDEKRESDGEEDKEDEEEEKDEGREKVAEEPPAGGQTERQEEESASEKVADRPSSPFAHRRSESDGSNSSSTSDEEVTKRKQRKKKRKAKESKGLKNEVKEETKSKDMENLGETVNVQTRNSGMITLSNGLPEKDGPNAIDTPRATAAGDSSDDDKIEFSNKDTSKKEIPPSSGMSTPDADYLAGFKAGLKASSDDKKTKDTQEPPPKPKVSGDTIHHACEEGDTAKVKQMIIEYPELKNKVDERGWTPLHITASAGHLDLIKWLSVSGVDLNKETPTGYTAMHVAAMNGHVNCIMILAAMGCSLNCKTVDAFTPLHLAAMSGHIECVKWLLVNRAKHDLLDIHGRTPYDLADEYQHDECASLLKSMKRELKKKDSIINLLRNPVHPPSPREGPNQTVEKEDDDESTWHSDTEDSASRPGSAKLSGRKSSRQEKENEEKQERRRKYQKQKEKIQKRGSSFLDSVRMDVDQSVDDDF